MRLGDNLTEIMEHEDVSVEKRRLCVVQFHIKKSGWEAPHVHKKSFEMYQIDSGKAKITIQDQEGKKEIVIPSEVVDYCIIEPGVEHTVYFEEGTDVTIYRFPRKKAVSVIDDTFSAEKLKSI